jgi:cation diffusion facilitator CzcD-associated flavoprotein CzcO
LSHVRDLIPRYPNFPGIKEFEGEAFHTNTWQEGFSAKGMRVAVIGTGASAVQVVPSLVDQEPASLTVFQRSPVWALPRGDYAYPEWAKIMFAVVPLAKRLYR